MPTSPVTTPPIQIPFWSRDGRSGPNTFSDQGGGHQWIFEYAGPSRLYVVTWSFITSAFDAPAVRIFKSTDGGTSWSGPVNDANSPPMGDQVFDVWQDGNSLHCLYANSSSGLLRIKTFTVGADTWGADSADGPNPVGGSFAYDQPGFKMVKRNSGDFWVFWNTSSSLNDAEGCKYSVFSAGVWGPEVTFTAEVAENRRPFSKLVYDSATDIIHVISIRTPQIPTPITWTIVHQTLTAGGVIGTLDTIGTIGTFNAAASNAAAPFIGKCTIANGNIIVPVTYFRSSVPATNKRLIVFVGTPVATPVWTPVLPNTVAGLPTNAQDYESYSFVSGGLIYVFFVIANGLNGSLSPQQLYYVSSSDGITWSAPVLHYDALANPQANPSPDGNYVHAVSVILQNNGQFGVALALQTQDNFSSSECIGYYLQATPAGPSIICDNPPNGQVGVAYTHTFPASGGTPPYTFALTAGILPPGLTLNTSTGVISGTPVAYGTFPFTIQVTDSLAQTASVNCQIVILAPPPPSIICDSPPSGQVGVAYTHTFPASSGVPPYTFSISAGALPNGLTLNSITGVVSGTPTASGTFNFTIRVTDSIGQTADVACTIIITGSNPCPDGAHDDVRPWISHYPPNAEE